MDNAISDRALAEVADIDVSFNKVLTSMSEHFSAQPDYRKQTLVKALEQWSDRVFRPLSFYKPNKEEN